MRTVMQHSDSGDSAIGGGFGFMVGIIMAILSPGFVDVWKIFASGALASIGGLAAKEIWTMCKPYITAYCKRKFMQLKRKRK